MRIVSYNILDGGTGRADLLADVIESQRPDVVCLVEAEDPHVVDALARRLKMDAVAAPGHNHASVLMTRWTIRESVNHALLHTPDAFETSLLEATVHDPTGREWVFGVVHLHARAHDADERRRERELDVLLPAFAPHRTANRPHVLCGDFNANSPVQQIDPERCKPKTREAWHANGGSLPRRVVQRLLDEGYVDSLHAVRGAAAGTAGSFTTEFPCQRVDYVFTFGLDRARLTDAWIEQGPKAKDASDHFPVGVEVV